MKFDSFCIIDDSGHKKKIKYIINEHSISKKRIKEHKTSKEDKLCRKRTTRYGERQRYKTKELSKSTLRNLKKYLSPYGNFSIKSKNYVFDGPIIKIEAFNNNVFKHLYLLDSVSGTYINIADYIVINMMGMGTEIHIDGTQFIFLGDYIGKLELALEKGNYNRLYFLSSISL